jgi:hypothetical protein
LSSSSLSISLLSAILTRSRNSTVEDHFRRGAPENPQAPELRLHAIFEH